MELELFRSKVMIVFWKLVLCFCLKVSGDIGFVIVWVSWVVFRRFFFRLKFYVWFC